MENQTFDLNLFRVNQTVNISGVAAMQKVTIKRISDSGVVIDGKDCGEIVVSGHSPATVCHRETVIDSAPVALVEESKPRQSYKDKMKNVQVPASPVFTIGEVAVLNDIPVPYAAQWVKQYCSEAGKAEKKEGVRGRVATLYKKL